MDIEYNNISELFIKPNKSKNKPITINGINFYTSDYLKEKLIYILKNKNPKIYPLLEKMIKDEIIVPYYITNNAFDFIKRKLNLLDDKESKNIVGFFNRETKKIYIIFENEVNIFLIAKTNNIINTIIHELIHYIVYLHPNIFWKKTKHIIHNFYKRFYTMYLNNTYDPQEFINDSIIDTIIINNFNFEIMKIKSFKKILYKNNDILKTYVNKNITRYNNLRFLNIALILFINTPESFVKSYNRYKTIIDMLIATYNKEFEISNIKSMPIQELIFPSEIISIYSETKKDYNLLKNILKK